jgi:hypothetical protein
MSGGRVPGRQGAGPLHGWAGTRSGESRKAAHSRSGPVDTAACRRSGADEGRYGGGRWGDGPENPSRGDRPATAGRSARQAARTGRLGADGSWDDRPRGDGPADRVGRRPTAVRAAAARPVAVDPPTVLGPPLAVRNHAADRRAVGHPALIAGRLRWVAGHRRLRVVVHLDAGRPGPGSGPRTGHLRAERNHLSGCRTQGAGFHRRRDCPSRRRSGAVPDAWGPGDRPPAHLSSASSRGACRVSSARLDRRQARPASTSRRQR